MEKKIFSCPNLELKCLSSSDMNAIQCSILSTAPESSSLIRRFGMRLTLNTNVGIIAQKMKRKGENVIKGLIKEMEFHILT